MVDFVVHGLVLATFLRFLCHFQVGQTHREHVQVDATTPGCAPGQAQGRA